MMYFILIACNTVSEEKGEVANAMQAELKLLHQIEQEPSQAHLYCGKLQTPKHVDYCNNITKRPHLWENIKTFPLVERKGGGPNAVHIKMKDISSGELRNTPPSKENCTTDTTHFQCRINNAKSLVESTAIASECNTLKPKEKRECYFLASEYHLRASSDTTLAFDLCNESDILWSSCIQHIVNHIAKATPLANAKPEKWTNILSIHQNIQEYWIQKYPSFTDIIVDYFWERVCSISLSKVKYPVGDMLDHLPQSAFPHIRSHIAYQTISSYRRNQFSLQQWTDIVLDRINRRSYDEQKRQFKLPQRTLSSNSSPKKHPPHFRQWDGIMKNWSHDSTNDQHFPAVYYMKDSRRVTSENLEVDIQIAILEALYRLNYDDAVFQEGLQSNSRYIQFTAYRLMKK